MSAKCGPRPKVTITENELPSNIRTSEQVIAHMEDIPEVVAMYVL